MKSFLLFLPVFVFLSLYCGKEVSTSPEEVFVPKIKVFVDSKPQGSKILIDGRYLGQFTPDTINWIEKGKHLVTLKQKLLKDSTLLINISGDTSLFFDYTTNPTMRGGLYLDTYPEGAEIYINDSILAFRTPHHLKNLFPAEYRILYKLPGYWDVSTKASVVSEFTITVKEVLPDSNVWVNFNSANIGLPTNEFNDIAIQDGYIKWLAGNGCGLIKYISGTDFTVYNTSNSSIPADIINSVRAGENGIWIATLNGIALFSNGTFKVYNSSNSPLPDSIKCVFPVPGGGVLAGSFWHGVFYFNGSVWKSFNTSNSILRTNRICSVFYDQNGIIWIGTQGDGLLTFDGNRWVRTYNALPSPRVESILITPDEIYAGTSQHHWIFFDGINYLDRYYPGGLAIRTNSWFKYPEAGQNIAALAKDETGNLWFSNFTSGLGKKSAEGFTRYTGYNGINGIAIDGQGNKWMSTSERGILKYKGK